MILAIDHVQIAAPEGCENAAREFCSGILGLTELPKPPSLQKRGGCWFQCGAQQLHIGVEASFQPAKKAHPAFSVSDLDELRAKLLDRGHSVRDDEELLGVRRLFVDDPWGNRIEFLAADGRR